MTRGATRRRRQRGSHKPRTLSRWEYDAAPRTFSKKSCSLRAARPLEKALQWPNCASGTHRSTRSRAAAPVPQPSDPAAPFLQTRPSLQRLRPRWPHTRLRQQSRHSLVRTRFFPRAGSDLISRPARVRARRRQSPESSFEIRYLSLTTLSNDRRPFRTCQLGPTSPSLRNPQSSLPPGKRFKAQARQSPRCVYQLAIACSKGQLPRAIPLSTLGKVRPLYFSGREEPPHADSAAPRKHGGAPLARGHLRADRAQYSCFSLHSLENGRTSPRTSRSSNARHHPGRNPSRIEEDPGGAAVC